MIKGSNKFLPSLAEAGNLEGRRSYLAAETDSSSSHCRIWRTLRRKMVADCLTSLLRSSTAAVTPATVRMKFVRAMPVWYGLVVTQGLSSRVKQTREELAKAMREIRSSKKKKCKEERDAYRSTGRSRRKLTTRRWKMSYVMIDDPLFLAFGRLSHTLVVLTSKIGGIDGILIIRPLDLPVYWLGEHDVKLKARSQ